MNAVLIVDDSATMRKMLRRVLGQTDLPIDVVLEAADGVDAIQQLVEQPDVRVVLCDWNMPRLDGARFLAAVRRRRTKEQLAVVLVTTERAEAIFDTISEDEVNAYLQKPLTPSDLRTAIAPYLRAEGEAA